MNSPRYKDILSIYKLTLVYKNIRTNTHHKDKLIKFEMGYTNNIITLYTVLKQRSYSHGRYNLFLISEPKYRIIMSERMADKVVNHLVSRYVLLPCLESHLIDTNVATRKDMGTKKAIYYFKKYVNSLKVNYDKLYVLKCDISKYFYNIDHEILIGKLSSRIKDRELMDLVSDIIRSTDKVYVNELIDRMVMREEERVRSLDIADYDKKVAELDRLPRYLPGKGLPIGNETSQILAVFYLSSLDHYIKEKLGIKCYIRYMDDFLLIHPDKGYLKKCLVLIDKEVRKLGLVLNNKTQIYDMNRGINFLGYKFVLKGKRLITLVDNDNKKRIKRKLKRLKKSGSERYKLVRASYKGYFDVADTKEFLYKLKW